MDKLTEAILRALLVALEIDGKEGVPLGGEDLERRSA